jgi:hypothetical protein
MKARDAHCHNGVSLNRIMLISHQQGIGVAELLKGRILGSRIPDIFKENSGHN